MSEEINRLCLEHGEKIASMKTLLSSTHIGVEKLNKKVDTIIMSHESRISVLEENKNSQPSPRTMMGLSTIGGAISVAAIWLGKKIIKLIPL